MVTIILFIVIFGVVVISHEFGHFLIAKANGIHVVEFSIGMGPTLWGFTKGDTKYSIKLFPIGGACMFEGEDGLEAREGEPPGEGSFLNARVWSRISTVVAGPIFNFILGAVIALILVNLIVIQEPVVGEVQPDSAAAEAGLAAGDRVVSIGGMKTGLYDDIWLFSLTNTGKTVKVRYERDGEARETSLTPKLDESTGRYMLGITGGQEIADVKGLDSFRYAWYEIRYCFRSTYKSLGMLFQGRVGRQDVAGPVGIAVNVVGKTYEAAKEYGFMNVLVNMLNITLLLSINLGVLNLLPLPALDGGRLVFLLLEVVRGKPVPPEKEGMVHFIGLMFFMGLMVLLLFNDLSNIFNPQ